MVAWFAFGLAVFDLWLVAGLYIGGMWVVRKVKPYADVLLMFGQSGQPAAVELTDEHVDGLVERVEGWTERE